jgi:hypothetical protein
MKAWFRAGAALALLSGGIGVARADTTYDTTTSWDGSTFASPWGAVGSATPTFGETFLAPTADTVLQDFTFYISGLGSGASVTFQADVYAWSGSLQGGNGPQGATGPALYTSANMTFTDDGSFQAVTITTGGVALTAGGSYVALLTTTAPTSLAANADSFGSFVWGVTFAHAAGDGGGGFNFDDNATSAQLGTTPWDDGADYGDAAWTADFAAAAVPEPSSVALLGVAGLCLAGYIRRRRRGPSPAA